MYPEIYNPPKYDHPGWWERHPSKEVFTCRNCRAYVYTQPLISGVQNRNHCPYCLWSRHVDLYQAGDRLSACKAGMEPIGLTMKQRQNKYGSVINGELMLIHRCSNCDRISINRIAADDLSVMLMEIYHASKWMDPITRDKLEESGIWLLQGTDHNLVITQLYGISQQ
ncbi:MAG: hypothetical protein A2Y88_07950 [Chloroflexi bacterium RBG_13_48_10]|nr:MAG: hypothetical protein A2Y88_07950 [Chloroflexi bacterium RBG_13_48_10]